MLDDLSKQARDLIKWLWREKRNTWLITYAAIEEGFHIGKRKRDSLLNELEMLRIGRRRDKGIDAALQAFELNLVLLKQYAITVLEEEGQGRQ